MATSRESLLGGGAQQRQSLHLGEMTIMTGVQRELLDATTAVVLAHIVQMHNEGIPFEPSVVLFTTNVTVIVPVDFHAPEVVDTLVEYFDAWAAVAIFETRPVRPSGSPAIAVVKRAIGFTDARVVDLTTEEFQSYLPPSSLFRIYCNLERHLVN